MVLLKPPDRVVKLISCRPEKRLRLQGMNEAYIQILFSRENLGPKVLKVVYIPNLITIIEMEKTGPTLEHIPNKLMEMLRNKEFYNKYLNLLHSLCDKGLFHWDMLWEHLLL